MPPPSEPLDSHRHRLPLPPLLFAAAILSTVFLLFVLLYRQITRKRTVLIDLKPPIFPPRRLSYSILRRATDSFSAANRLGQGGFGSVYKGVLPLGQEIAVKMMSEASLHGEREFRNELSVASSMDAFCCSYIVSLLGFSTSGWNRDCRFWHYGRRKKRRGRRSLLVYEYMQNGSLQDALLDRRCEELMHWNKRFAIIMSVAKGLDYLHNSCETPIIHGDIKPSNILLDSNFDAKIADFGLAQLLTREEEEKIGTKGSAPGSMIEENESVAAEEDAAAVDEKQSSGSYLSRITHEGGGLGAADASPSKRLEKEGSASKGIFDRMSVDDGNGKGVVEMGKSDSGRECRWWKQENMNGLSDSGRVKDYVKEAMRKEKSSRQPREWWKVEFCNELAKKTKERGLKCDGEGEISRQWDGDGVPEITRPSTDRWMDGEHDLPSLSSATSTRGTVCYVAPEHGQVSDKSDVYSFGVLLLVLVSGRRPLQVTASPMPEFERANLISWARQLALSGRLLDLVDSDIQSLDEEQAELCLSIALLCLQRFPGNRPTMKEIVGMFSGEAEPLHLPFEFSPSPPSNSHTSRGLVQ